MKKEILEEMINNKKNLIVDGDMISGKTTNVLFPLVEEMINKEESMMILDSKEEYINEYYDKLKENNYNIITINLRNFDNSDGWNPLEYSYSLYKEGNLDKAQEYLEKIGKTIFYERPKADPFWDNAASDFMTGVTLGLFEDAKEEEINFNSINTIFNDSKATGSLIDYITMYFNMKDKKSAPYVFASTTFLAPKETRDSILSIAKQGLRPFVSKEKLSKLLSKTTFSYKKVLNEKTAIFFVNTDENKTLDILPAMFIVQLYNFLIANKVDHQFNFVIDNFDSIERIDSLVDMLSSCTSRKIKFLIGTRSIDDLIHKYSNYVLKLCNSVIINSANIELNIDGNEKNISKEFKEVIIKKSNIDYPKLTDNEIKIFDIEKFVIENEKKVLGLNKTNSSVGVRGIDVGEMIKKIDKKIEEIESTKFYNTKESLDSNEDGLKKTNKSFESNNAIDLVFDAFHGGFGGPSHYYYISKNINTNEYEFKYGYSKSGMRISRNSTGENIKITTRSKEYYEKFINEISNIVNDWNSEYYNSNIMGGTQWHIKFLENNTGHSGSNDFPLNYKDAILIMNKYFN